MDRMRTMLFCPANQPKHYINAPVFQPDCILFDLEDAIAPQEKDAARDLLCEALRSLQFSECRVYARVNSLRTEFCRRDLEDTAAAGLRHIRLAMCERPDDVAAASQILTEAEREAGIREGSVTIQCSIETPRGVLNAREIVKASDRVESLSFGAEDYTRCMGTNRGKEGRELYFARSCLPVIAAEAGIPAVDTVWPFLDDLEGFEREARQAREMGFSGKSCIHPNQIRIVHSIFSPTQDEIEQAEAVITALKRAENEGKGVFTVGGKMVDAPVISRARRTLVQAGKGALL